MHGSLLRVGVGIEDVLKRGDLLVAAPSATILQTVHAEQLDAAVRRTLIHWFIDSDWN